MQYHEPWVCSCILQSPGASSRLRPSQDPAQTHPLSRARASQRHLQVPARRRAYRTLDPFCAAFVSETLRHTSVCGIDGRRVSYLQAPVRPRACCTPACLLLSARRSAAAAAARRPSLTPRGGWRACCCSHERSHGHSHERSHEHSHEHTNQTSCLQGATLDSAPCWTSRCIRWNVSGALYKQESAKLVGWGGECIAERGRCYS
jgi:hypothetical protein